MKTMGDLKQLSAINNTTVNTVQYDIMPADYFPGIQSARSGFFKGRLVFHFNSDQKTYHRIRSACANSSIHVTDMHVEMPELIPNMDYRYAFSIPQIQYIDQAELLHEILKG